VITDAVKLSKDDRLSSSAEKKQFIGQDSYADFIDFLIGAGIIKGEDGDYTS